MNLKDITIVVAVDEEYTRKLDISFKTWMKFKPEMREMPLLIIYDKDQINTSHRVLAEIKDKHPDVRFGAWQMKADNQREKMLNSLVFGPARYVDTKWYLKLDADTYARSTIPWMLDEWFAKKDGKEPVFTASPWGYSKPANVLEKLDDWADGVEGLKKYPRLNVPVTPGSGIVVSHRIASWVMYAKTEWTKEVVSYTNGKLPFPSQDTFLWYCAERRKDHYNRFKQARFGWGHKARYHSLLKVCTELLK